MSILISLLIWCIVFGLIYWIITMLPLPAPFKQIATVVFLVIALIALILFMTGSLAFPFVV